MLHVVVFSRSHLSLVVCRTVWLKCLFTSTAGRDGYELTPGLTFHCFFARDGGGGAARRGSGGFEAGRGCILRRSRDGGGSKGGVGRMVCVCVCACVCVCVRGWGAGGKKRR